MLEDDSLEWYHLSVCRGMETNYFYDDYESDPLFAKVMDGICLSCPVRKMCLRWGVENSEYGLWGGVFLNNGKTDKARNAHKTEDIWSEIRGGIDA
jgi:WhiB family transcriptional regulator, redox-sensing transcriptional regulator